MTDLIAAQLLLDTLEKVEKAYNLLIASLDHLACEDITAYQTAEDQEPIDAFVIRLERFVELVMGKLAKNIAIYEHTAVDGTNRDRLLLLEKVGIIDDVDTWIDIRNMSNRIVHDYLENITIEIYTKTNTEYRQLFESFWYGIKTYRDKREIR